MEKLWRYTPESGFTNKNAGFSMWCFGTCEGKDYFIKQFLSPKYPAEDKFSSPERIARKKADCERFERRHRRMYDMLTKLSDGNDVRILEFFRVASRYYIVTEKVDALPWTVETVAALPEEEKRRLCAIISHAVAALHKGSLVHSDIKHDNILYTYTEGGTVTAKIIDFDGGFLEDSPPTMEDGVTGDINYFSPEACARTFGEERPLSCKMDVFALGVLFHQYFSGQMPGYDREGSSCPGEAVLKGLPLEVSSELPEDVKELVVRMLAADPAARPSSHEVFRAFKTAPDEEIVQFEDEEGSYRFCTLCGKRMRGAERICSDCQSKETGSDGQQMDIWSPFRQAGDL